jgi:hypothetical protein
LRLDPLHHTRIKPGPRFSGRRSQFAHRSRMTAHGSNLASALVAGSQMFCHGSRFDARQNFFNIVLN